MVGLAGGHHNSGDRAYPLDRSRTPLRHRPVGGADYPRSSQEFADWFPDETACIEYLARMRWPSGFVCPGCEGERSWRIGDSSWMCVTCGRKTSVTAGTIFHRSHAPLSVWLAAIWYVTSQRDGVSARGLQQALGLGSYETAWAWLQKLRRAMARPEDDRLAGTIEVDETLVDGSLAARTRVLVAVERLSRQRLGRVRFGIVEQSDGVRYLSDFAHRAVEQGSTIRIDAAGPRVVASDLKRWMAGTLGHRVSRAHLQSYLDEYAFRFDRRDASARGMLFYELLQHAVGTAPHPVADLVHRP